MIDTVQPEEIASTVRNATLEVFSTMLSLPLEAQPFHEEHDPAEAFDGVVGLVGIAGSWTGTGRIACSPKFACKMAGSLLMAEYESVNDDVLDAAAEVANMIIGNVKTMFEEKLGPLGLSVPTVIYGRNYRTHSSGVMKWTVVPFVSGEDVMHVSFCLMPTRTHAHPHPVKSEALQSA